MKITVFKPLVVRSDDYIVFVEYAEGWPDLFFLKKGKVLHDIRDYTMYHDIMYRPNEVLGVKYAESFFPTNGTNCSVIPAEVLLTEKKASYRTFMKNLLEYSKERK